MGLQYFSTVKEIPLTKGYVALVDDEDYERVSALKWNILLDRRADGSIKAKYAVCTKHDLRLHRFVLSVTDPKIFVDHEDHDGLNCQKHNLRVCNNRQNLWNARKTARPSTSQYKGVCKNKGDLQWVAYVTLDGKCKTLGYFDDEMDAARAYDAAAQAIYGEFAHLNFPTKPS